MARPIFSGIVIDGKQYVEFAGTSDEIKPVGGILTGSIFWEVDTSGVYGYIEGADAGSEWVFQMYLNGGGGSSSSGSGLLGGVFQGFGSGNPSAEPAEENEGESP